MPTHPERARHATLQRYLALDTAIPETLTRICELAAHLSGLPCASVQLIDDEHQHRVAGLGVELGPTALPGRPLLCDGLPVRAWSSHPLRDREGQVLGTLSVCGPEPARLDEVTLRMLDHLADETMAAFEYARTTRDLAHGATHDALTGLPNRVLVNDRLEHSLLRRERGRLAVALLDVVGLERINDTRGHAAGDSVLRQVAGRLLRFTRTGDTVARIGGDEFLVVAEDLDPGGEQIVLDRLRSAFEEPVPLDSGPLEVRASIGLVLAERGDTVDVLLGRADEAMYADKRAAAG